MPKKNLPKEEGREGGGEKKHDRAGARTWDLPRARRGPAAHHGSCLDK